MLGGPQYVLDDFTAATAEVMAETDEPKDWHMNAQGWFSHGVLAAVLQNTAPPQWRLTSRRATVGDWDALTSEDSISGALINVRGQHWVSVCKHEGHAFYCDSMYAPHLIDAEDWATILLRHPDASLVIAHDSDWDLG